MKKISIILLTLSLFAAGCSPATPTETPAPTEENISTETDKATSAEIIEAQGEVDAQLAETLDFVPARIGMLLSAVSQIKTGTDGYSRLDLINGSIVRVGPRSHFSLEDIHEENQGTVARLKMTIGQVWIILNGGEVDVETPAGLAGIRGSYMGIRVEAGSARISCLEGTCSLNTPSESITIPVGKTAIAQEGEPVQIEPVSEEDLQGWLDFNPEAVDLVEGFVPELESAPPSTTIPSTEDISSAPTGHVNLPPLSCLSSGDCEEYCRAGEDDPPAECTAFESALIAQGVNFGAFKSCIDGGGDPQTCADNAR